MEAKQTPLIDLLERVPRDAADTRNIMSNDLSDSGNGRNEMTEDYIHTCDLCGADAGEGPYHATMGDDRHVHICEACFDPQQHDIAVLKQQREELLAENEALLDALRQIAEWPNGGNRYGQENIKRFAQAALDAALAALSKENKA